MKKIIAFVLFILVPVIVYGASTMTETTGTTAGGTLYYNTYVVTADTGATYSHTTTQKFRGYIYQVETVPDSSASGNYPADNYDITLTNDNGIDIMGGALANRDTVNAEIAFPLSSNSVEIPTAVNSVLTFNFTNQSTDSASVTIRLWWIKKD